MEISITKHTEGTGWTVHGRQLITTAFWEKGLGFYAAAMLLHQNGGHPYVVRNLLCQAIEICGKAYLLETDFSTYEPELRSTFGHKLVKIAEAVQDMAEVTFLTPNVRKELEGLDVLYSKHLLRYGSGYDVLVDGASIPADRVGLRFARLLYARLRKTQQSPPS